MRGRDAKFTERLRGGSTAQRHVLVGSRAGSPNGRSVCRFCHGACLDPRHFTGEDKQASNSAGAFLLSGPRRFNSESDDQIDRTLQFFCLRGAGFMRAAIKQRRVIRRSLQRSAWLGYGNVRVDRPGAALLALGSLTLSRKEYL